MTMINERLALVKKAINSKLCNGNESQRRKFTRLCEENQNSSVVLFGTDSEIKSVGLSFVVIDNLSFSDTKKKFLHNTLFNCN
jgi:hypothetical protein